MNEFNEWLADNIIHDCNNRRFIWLIFYRWMSLPVVLRNRRRSSSGAPKPGATRTIWSPIPTWDVIWWKNIVSTNLLNATFVKTGKNSYILVLVTKIELIPQELLLVILEKNYVILNYFVWFITHFKIFNTQLSWK